MRRKQILGNLPKNGLTAGCSKQGSPRLKGHPRPDPNKNCPLCVWHPQINKAVRSLLKSRELGLGLYWWYPGYSQKHLEDSRRQNFFSSNRHFVFLGLHLHNFEDKGKSCGTVNKISERFSDRTRSFCAGFCYFPALKKSKHESNIDKESSSSQKIPNESFSFI